MSNRLADARRWLGIAKERLATVTHSNADVPAVDAVRDAIGDIDQAAAIIDSLAPSGLDVERLAVAQAIADGLTGSDDELDHEYAAAVAAEYARLTAESGEPTP